MNSNITNNSALKKKKIKRRSIIYASERKGIYTETNGIVEVYYAKDFKFSDFKRDVMENL